MDDSSKVLPKVPISFRIGNRGEAFLEFIMSKHCLMHKIAGYKDIGLDFLCEWLVEGSPTRIIFGVQVKTSDIKEIELVSLGKNVRFNELEKFKFKKAPSWKIEEKTINYWLGFEIPVYLFFVIRNGTSFECYYQRLTPRLHLNDKSTVIKRVKAYKDEELYKVNDGNSEFIAYIPRQDKDGGFARDLFIDSIRCSYFNGSVGYRDSKEFGLKGWGDGLIYPDILDSNNCPYMDNVEKSLMSLKNLGLIEIKSNWKEIIIGLKKKILKNIQNN